MNEREEYQDAKVVKAMQMTGIFKNVLEKTRSKDGSNNVLPNYLGSSPLIRNSLYI